MNGLFGFFLESTVMNFDVNKEVKVFPRKVIMLVVEEMFLLLPDEHIIILCFYFSC